LVIVGVFYSVSNTITDEYNKLVKEGKENLIWYYLNPNDATLSHSLSTQKQELYEYNVEDIPISEDKFREIETQLSDRADVGLYVTRGLFFYKEGYSDGIVTLHLMFATPDFYKNILGDDANSNEIYIGDYSYDVIKNEYKSIVNSSLLPFDSIGTDKIKLYNENELKYNIIPPSLELRTKEYFKGYLIDEFDKTSASVFIIIPYSEYEAFYHPADTINNNLYMKFDNLEYMSDDISYAVNAISEGKEGILRCTIGNDLSDFIRKLTPLKNDAEYYLFLSIIALIIAGIGLMCLILIFIERRTREYAISICVGANKTHIALSVLVEIFFLAVVSTIFAIGIILYLINVKNISFQGLLVRYNKDGILLMLIFSAVITIATSILPIYKISRFTPVKLIKS
jgi:ABC-type antimicrobial peptide transport system permease subunit